MVVLALHEKVVKVLSVVRLATHKLLKSVDAAVGLELLATTLADKHTVTVLPNFVLVRHWQRLERLVTTLSLVFCPTTQSLGTVGQALGCLHKGLAYSSIQVPNNDRLEIIHKYKIVTGIKSL